MYVYINILNKNDKTKHLVRKYKTAITSRY